MAHIADGSTSEPDAEMCLGATDQVLEVARHVGDE